MVLRPVGDLPPSVYWVRRLVLLVLLLLVVALVWWWWPSGGDDGDPTAGQTSPTPTPSATSATTSPEPSKTKTSDPGQTDEPETTECADSAIEVTVATDAESYAAGEQPDLTFTVENVSDQTCSRDVGASANELTVTSGGSQIWSSDDCNPGGGADFDTLRPGDRFVQTVSWPRVPSSEGCPTPDGQADSGTYARP